MAIHFAGGTDKVAYGGSGYLGHVLGCIAFWMRTTQATANAVPISIWNSSSRNGFGFLLNNTANKLTVQCYNTTGTPSINMTGTATMNGGGWKHVALNWNQNNGGTNTCYVDGVSDSTANSSPAWAFDNSLGVPPTFGRNPDAF